MCRPRRGGAAVGAYSAEVVEAFVIGALAQSSLLIGGLLVYAVTLPSRLVGQLAGLGAGALLAAAAFQLVPEAQASLDSLEVGVWLLVGGSVFIVADRLIERRLGDSGAMGIVVGNINDALPESLIFGIQLGSGLVLSLPFVAAVWVSNIPQVIPPAADLAAGGWARSKQAILWAAIVLVAGACSAVGFVVADWLGDVNGARLAAFTIGGLITMLTTSMIPFAYEKGGLSAGIWAVVGFGVTLASS
jgi:ZIP family zinc transporter